MLRSGTSARSSTTSISRSTRTAVPRRPGSSSSSTRSRWRIVRMMFASRVQARCSTTCTSCTSASAPTAGAGRSHEKARSDPGRRVARLRGLRRAGDQGCGIVWRLKDKDNYYITRANALEDNVHLYHTVNGRRVKFAGWNGKVTSGVWHELAMEMVGNHIQVFFDGNKVIDDHDDTFKDAGKFGVWTKADSIIQFDDLRATPK